MLEILENRPAEMPPVRLQVDHRFGWMILDGLKRHTFRRRLKCTPGDKLLLELSLYDKNGHYTYLFPAVCKSVHGLKFDHQGVMVDGRLLSIQDGETFARNDGFIDFQEMLDWVFVKYNTSQFNGFLMKW